MIPELGNLALTLALAVAVVQSFLPMLGASRGNILWMRSALTTSSLQFVLIALSFSALMRSFIVSDFSVVNVASNSHSLKPLLFKIAGTWGSHEGSLLLWVLILAAFGASVTWFGANIPDTLRARTLSVQAWISVGFLSFLLLTSNPFERVFPAPLDGNGLNPLLQDFGLALHPPFLYLGYVGFSIVYSFAVAALIEGRIDPAWARWVRPWTLAAWVCLTIGIALGSWWAYYELGWGGWWFWDPVENVSFIPWLVGTALLHSAIVVEKRGAFKSWTVLLAILTFAMSLLGTFIVRSGVLTSVHAFATDPERGLYILALLGITIGGSLALYAVRAPAMEAGGLYRPISRESGLLVNNLLLTTAAATVLFGTLYPLLLEAVTGDKISVGPPFFNASFVPLMLPLIIIAGVGPFLSWKRADLGGIVDRLKWAAGITAVVLLITWYLNTDGPVLGIVSFGFAIWLLLTTIQEWAWRVKLFKAPISESMRRARNLPRSSYGMALAHAGIAIAILGFVGSTMWKSESVTFATPGDQVEIAGYELTFIGAETVLGPNYTSRQGTLQVTRDGKPVTELYPERRNYAVAGSSTTESAILSTIRGDLYTSISEPAAESAEGKWTLRILFEPLVGLIWLGAFMLSLGGILSLTDRRLRIGAPTRAQNPMPQPAFPAE
ncbi:c-type cytochrome biogenesis protein CcmF [Rhodobacterales bacterium 52_120_T64]|nr:c-type cytochrome biogenesis protein CcmF [Rhodobacterales bacterium 52_120_T64]